MSEDKKEEARKEKKVRTPLTREQKDEKNRRAREKAAKAKEKKEKAERAFARNRKKGEKLAVEELKKGMTVAAIKAYRDATLCSIEEAKAVIDGLSLKLPKKRKEKGNIIQASVEKREKEITEIPPLPPLVEPLEHLEPLEPIYAYKVFGGSASNLTSYSVSLSSIGLSYPVGEITRVNSTLLGVGFGILVFPTIQEAVLFGGWRNTWKVECGPLQDPPRSRPSRWDLNSSLYRSGSGGGGEKNWGEIVEWILSNCVRDSWPYGTRMVGWVRPVEKVERGGDTNTGY